MPYTVLGQPHLLGLPAALTINGLDLLASVGGTVNYLFLVDACNAFYSSGLVLTTCLLPLVGFAGSTRADRACTHCGGIAIAVELHMVHECPVLQPPKQQYAALLTFNTEVMFCTAGPDVVRFV